MYNNIVCIGILLCNNLYLHFSSRIIVVQRWLYVFLCRTSYFFRSATSVNNMTREGKKLISSSFIRNLKTKLPVRIHHKITQIKAHECNGVYYFSGKVLCDKKKRSRTRKSKRLNGVLRSH